MAIGKKKQQEPKINEQSISCTCDFLVAEYNILRKEIDVYHNHQHGFLKLNLALFSISLSFFGFIVTQPQAVIEQFSYIFLLFPVVFSLFSLLYTDKTVRIIRIADYLHNYLRLKANSLSSDNVFQWEIYKRKTTLFNRRITLLLDRIRWMIFILPSVFLVSVFLFLHGLDKWTAIELGLLLADSICIFVSFIVMYVADETLGIQCSPKHDLDNIPEP